MDLAVLADLEREGVEAEGLDLPAQRLHLPVGDPRQAIGDEALLKLDDLVEELGGRGVAAAPATPVDEMMARLPQALADAPEALAVGLIGIVSDEFGEGVAELSSVLLEPRREAWVASIRHAASAPRSA